MQEVTAKTSPFTSQLDRLISRILFVAPPAASIGDKKAENKAAAPAERAFGFSLAFSGVRCILQYAILPFVLPIIGVAGSVATNISLVINLVALASLFYSVRRLWKINYSRKWQYLAFATVVFIILISFVLLDLGVLHA